MVRDLALDVDGDLALANGDLQLISDKPAIKQSILIRLQFFRGEWYLDTSAGVPWFQDVLKKNPDPKVLQSVFRSAILETPGVSSLDALDVTRDNASRKLSVAFRAATDQGLLADTVRA